MADVDGPTDRTDLTDPTDVDKHIHTQIISYPW